MPSIVIVSGVKIIIIEIESIIEYVKIIIISMSGIIIDEDIKSIISDAKSIIMA